MDAENPLSCTMTNSLQHFAQDARQRTADKQLSEERQNFIKILKSESKYAELQEVSNMTASNKVKGITEFFQGYIWVSDLFDGAVGNPKSQAFPNDHLLLDLFTGFSYTRNSPSKKANSVLMYSVLDLYYNYVRSGSKQKLYFITRNDREYLGRGLTEFAWSGLVSMTVIDNLALRAIDSYFFNAYPKYLLYKGNAHSQRLIDSHASKQVVANFHENIFLDDFLSDIYSTSPIGSPLVSRSRPKKLVTDPLFEGFKDNRVISLKQKLVKILCDKSSLQEFDEVINMTGGVEKIMKPIMSFLLNYLSFTHVIAQSDYRPQAGFQPKFTKEQPLLQFFQSGNPIPGLNKQITPNMCHKICNMYSFFIATDGIQKIPLLTPKMRRAVADNTDKMTQSLIVSTDVFDKIAIHCLEVMLLYCLPKYLIFKGDHQAEKKLTSLQEDWEKFLDPEAATFASGTLEEKFVALEKRMLLAQDDDQWNDKKPVSFDLWEFLSQFFFHKSMHWNLSKNGLAAALIKEKGVNIINRVFEQNNIPSKYIKCWEVYFVLESINPAVATKKSAIARFVERAVTPESPQPSPLLPHSPSMFGKETATKSMMPIYLYFYYKFVHENSPMRVEAANSALVIKDVTSSLENRTTLKVNVFDTIIDVVLEKLYDQYTSSFEIISQNTK